MKRSRSATTGTKIKFYYTKERLGLISRCSNRGKSGEDIMKALKEKKVDFKKRLEELKKQGFSPVITTNFNTNTVHS
jgi:hypothetical protein